MGFVGDVHDVMMLLGGFRSVWLVLGDEGGTEFSWYEYHILVKILSFTCSAAFHILEFSWGTNTISIMVVKRFSLLSHFL